MSKNAFPRRTGEKTKKRVVIRPHPHCSARPARFIHWIAAVQTAHLCISAFKKMNGCQPSKYLYSFVP